MVRFIKINIIFFIAFFSLILSMGNSAKAERGDTSEKIEIVILEKDAGTKEELINDEPNNSNEGTESDSKQYIDAPVDEVSNDTEQATEEFQANDDELDLIGELEEDTQITTDNEDLTSDSREQIDLVADEFSDTEKLETPPESKENDSIKQPNQLTKSQVQVQVIEEKEDTKEEPRQNAFQVGERHEDTIKLKQHLSYLGFHISNNPTSLYGSVTESQVKAFQRKYGLEVTGIADQETWRKIEELLASPLQIGLYRKDVVELKDNLKVLGFRVSNNPTIYFGAVTEAKVREFQQYYGLNITGVADRNTLDRINEILSSPFQNGKRDQGTKKLKSDLAKLGFAVPGNGTELYGTSTESRVKELQSYYKLKVNGIADHVTLAKISDILSSPLQNGKRHQNTIKLKADLAKLGFKVAGSGTTLYGTKTKQKVEEFQRYYGLVRNGIADDITLEKMKSILSSPLQYGRRHNDTKKLKSDLKKLGFSVSGNGTRLFAAETEKKVKEFQLYYGLVSNGIADEVTLNHMASILSSPLQKGKRHKETVKLKKDLGKLNYFISANPTTLYGATTEQQVRKFQKDNGLKVNGIADSVTLKKLASKVKKAKASSNVVKIFLDPGHGGKDSGATGYGIKEKDVVLDIALKAAQVLRTNYLGVEVKLSRTTDKFVELTDRAKMANNWGANYFVSIHNNAFNGSASGFESFIHNGKVSNNTVQKQKEIHQALMKKLGVANRGMKKANFSVLRNTNMPSILLEYLFIDNRKENDLLKSTKYRNWLGEITAHSIAQAFNLKKR